MFLKNIKKYYKRYKKIFLFLFKLLNGLELPTFFLTLINFN